MKNGIVIDGVAHELVESGDCVCTGCSLRKRCIETGANIGELCLLLKEWRDFNNKSELGVTFKEVKPK